MRGEESSWFMLVADKNFGCVAKVLFENYAMVLLEIVGGSFERTALDRNICHLEKKSSRLKSEWEELMDKQSDSQRMHAVKFDGAKRFWWSSEGGVRGDERFSNL